MVEEQPAATIREAHADDAPAIAAIYAPYVTDSSVSFELAAPDGVELAARIAGAEDRYPWLVCERAGEVLGYAYASEYRSRAAYRWALEVSVYVRQDTKRARVAHGLYTALFDVLRLQRRTLALAGITLPNPPSVGFHESFGFERFAVYANIGHKHDAWHDVGWWQLAIGEPAEPPAEPVMLSALRDTMVFADALASGAALVRR
jgi:phosphinothricin acetyltransferase